MTKPTINVLVVEDSASMRELLTHILSADPQISIAGFAHNGKEALAWLELHEADVVLMDIHMPVMDGFEATRSIMETRPVPIIIATATSDPKELATTFRAMEAGAVGLLAKPVGIGAAEYLEMSQNIVSTVKLMSEVKVVRRWSRNGGKSDKSPVSWESTAAPSRNGRSVVVMGASTGGPLVIQTILAALPRDFALPVLIVQHIATGFLAGFVEWLGQTTGVQVQVAGHGMRPLPGHAYLAPDDFHLGLDASGQIVLSKEAPENNLRPAVSFLFRSAAHTCGASAIGVLLTGMGQDGAAELKLMKDVGAVTIAQDAETALINGMPGVAVSLGAATHVLPPEKIAETLMRLANNHGKKE